MLYLIIHLKVYYVFFYEALSTTKKPENYNPAHKMIEKFGQSLK